MSELESPRFLTAFAISGVRWGAGARPKLFFKLAGRHNLDTKEMLWN